MTLSGFSHLAWVGLPRGLQADRAFIAGSGVRACLMVMRCSSSTTKMRSSRSKTWRDSCSQGSRKASASCDCRC